MGSRVQEFTSTVGACISNFWSELGTLSEDLDESIGGMEEKLSNTSRYQNYEGSKAIIDNFDDEPDVPDFLADLKVVYTNDTRTRESATYNIRLDNMVAMLQGAVNATSAHLESDKKITDEQRTDAEELVETLENVIAEMEGLSFD